MTDIEQLGFSVRTHNCLKRAKIDTVEQLAQVSDDDLLRIRSFGAGCLAEVRRKVSRPKQTNADRIRAMSDEELATVIMCPDGMKDQPCSDADGKCVACCLRWLQQPAEVAP